MITNVKSSKRVFNSYLLVVYTLWGWSAGILLQEPLCIEKAEPLLARRSFWIVIRKPSEITFKSDRQVLFQSNCSASRIDKSPQDLLSIALWSQELILRPKPRFHESLTFDENQGHKTTQFRNICILIIRVMIIDYHLLICNFFTFSSSSDGFLSLCSFLNTGDLLLDLFGFPILPMCKWSSLCSNEFKWFNLNSVEV